MLWPPERKPDNWRGKIFYYVAKNDPTAHGGYAYRRIFQGTLRDCMKFAKEAHKNDPRGDYAVNWDWKQNRDIKATVGP